MDDHGNAVHRNRWTIAAVAGLVAFLMFWLVVGWTFLGGLLAGLIVFGILLLVIRLIGADAPEEQALAGRSQAGTPGVATGNAAAAGPATRPAPARVSDAPVPASAPVKDPAPAGAADPAAASAADPAPVAERGPAEEPAPTADAAPPAEESVPPAEESLPPAEEHPSPAEEPLSPVGEPASPVEEAVPRVGATASKPETLSAPRDGRPDDLRRIRGIGPKLAALCNRLGFWHFDQIAGWTEAEVEWVDTHLEGFRGRARRDGWVTQAQALLASQDAPAPDAARADGPREAQ